MKKLLNMIKNYKDLNVDDLLTVVNVFDYFIPQSKANAFCQAMASLYEEYSLTDVAPFNMIDDSKVQNKICEVFDTYFDSSYFEETVMHFENETMYDTDNCFLNDFFKECNKTELVAFLKVLVRVGRHGHFFMSHNNFINFWGELVQECRKVDLSVDKDISPDDIDILSNHQPINFYVLSEECIKKIILNYLDLHFVLADNTLEGIMNNKEMSEEELVADAIQFIAQTVSLHDQLRYRANVMM